MRSLSASLKHLIPTGPAARIIEPGSVEWMELQRGAAYTPTAAGSAAAGGAGAALAGVMMGGGGGGGGLGKTISVEEAVGGAETSTSQDATSAAAKQRYATTAPTCLLAVLGLSVFSWSLVSTQRSVCCCCCCLCAS